MSKPKGNKALKRPNFDNSRKTQRKQKRLQKKVHRQEHYMKQKTESKKHQYPPGTFVKRPIENEDPVPGVKKKKPKLQIQVTAQDIISKDRAKDMKEANKLKSQMDKRRKIMLQEANEEDDKLIKKLEKQLGLAKSKNKNNYFADDGLDYLLEVCDRSTTEQIVAAEKHLADVEGDSDFEEDLAAVTGKEIPAKSKTKKDKQTDEFHSKNQEKDSEIESNEGSLDESLSENEDVNENASDNEDISGSENEDLSEDDELSENEYLTRNEEISDDDSVHDSTSDEPEEKPTKLQKSNRGEKNKTEDKHNSTLSKFSKERIIKEDELDNVFSDDEVSHLAGDDDNGKDTEKGTSDVKKGEKPDVWEDIYGRKRDKDGNIIKEEKGIYIPPHLRNKDATSDKQLAQLKRQIKSVLNKLSGTNLHWACNSVESVYACNSRNSVNVALSQLWREATVGGAARPPRLLAEHAALLAALTANVAHDIGAYFLQDLVKRFDEMMQKHQPVEDKHLDNLVACLAHLYSFKIFESPLLYDILNRLLEELTEKNIDCVLVTLRYCGAVLRKQAPAQLKQFIQDTQHKATGLTGNADNGSRIKFLLEVLLAIKNNNLMKIPNYDPSYQEHLTKVIRTIIRKGNYITPLNIKLEDLLKADERGKWWVVGSAWEGNQLQTEKAPAAAQPQYEQKLLDLARKQRMNTDLRRNIFCIIMSADDYMDAFEKLQHLGLKGQQQREVVHVLLACCLQETSSNRYYGVLAQKLCDADRRYQLSIQFAVWDKIKDIENQPKQCLTNLAQLLVHLIMDKGLALSVLKVIQFSDLNKQSVRFMRQILLAIIMNEDLQSSLEAFHRISKSPKLHMFRESLKLFIQHFLIKNAGKKSNVLSDKEIVILKERAAEVDKILTMYDSKLKF